MKKKQLAYSCTNKFLYLPLILLSALSLATGCRKTDNHCEGILSERPPTMIGVVFVDGQTGENILLSKNIDTSNITITSEGTGFPAENGVIVKRTGTPTYGALVFHIADTQKGVFKYKIDISDVGSISLSYTNTEEKTDNECKPYYIKVADPVIEDRQFTITGAGGVRLIEVKL